MLYWQGRQVSHSRNFKRNSKMRSVSKFHSYQPKRTRETLVQLQWPNLFSNNCYASWRISASFRESFFLKSLFAIWSYRYLPNASSKARLHSARSPTYAFWKFMTRKLSASPSPVRSFSHGSAVTRSPHEKKNVEIKAWRVYVQWDLAITTGSWGRLL